MNTTADITPETASKAVDRMLEWLDGQGAEPDTTDSAPKAAKPEIVPFNTQGVHASVVEAYEAVKGWLRAMKLAIPPYSLTLMGKSGCGKTHLIRNAVAYLNAAKYTCAYYSWPTLLQYLREDEQHTLESLKGFKALALDDIGAENTSGKYTRGLSADLLCRIVELRLGKWTLYASGYTMKGIADTYNTRVASRLIRNGGRIQDMSAAQDYSLLNPNPNL